MLFTEDAIWAPGRSLENLPLHLEHGSYTDNSNDYYHKYPTECIHQTALFYGIPSE